MSVEKGARNVVQNDNEVRDAAGAMVDSWNETVENYRKKLSGKYLDYFNAHIDDYLNWVMDGENDSYPIASWFYQNGFEEVIDDDIFKTLDM